MIRAPGATFDIYGSSREAAHASWRSTTASGAGDTDSGSFTEHADKQDSSLNLSTGLIPTLSDAAARNYGTNFIALDGVDHYLITVGHMI